MTICKSFTFILKKLRKLKMLEIDQIAKVIRIEMCLRVQISKLKLKVHENYLKQEVVKKQALKSSQSNPQGLLKAKITAKD
jgi:hypothetical protein